MATMVTKIIHQDEVISATKNLCNMLREAWGSLAEPAPVPAANLIFDVLLAAGITETGISIVLGKDALEILEGSVCEPIQCGLCNEPASHLVNAYGGTYLVCDEHAEKSKLIGLEATHI